MEQGFDYGPFSQGAKVLVYHETSDEWHVGTVQCQHGDSVFIEDESGLLDYYDEVSVHECFPAYHSDVAKDVAEYEKLFAKIAELDEEIRRFLQEEVEIIE